MKVAVAGKIQAVCSALGCGGKLKSKTPFCSSHWKRVEVEEQRELLGYDKVKRKTLVRIIRRFAIEDGFLTPDPLATRTKPHITEVPEV